MNDQQTLKGGWIRNPKIMILLWLRNSWCLSNLIHQIGENTMNCFITSEATSMGLFGFGYDFKTLDQFDEINLARINPHRVVKELVHTVTPTSMTNDFTQMPRTPNHSFPWVVRIVYYTLRCAPPDTLCGNLRILPLLYPITLLIVDDAPSHTVHLKDKRHHIVTYY